MEGSEKFGGKVVEALGERETRTGKMRQTGQTGIQGDFDEGGYVAKSLAVYIILAMDVVVNSFFEPPRPTLLEVLVVFMYVLGFVRVLWRVSECVVYCVLLCLCLCSVCGVCA